ncbi:amidohydrolase family protein [Cohnella sp. GCM10027633]|uniref:amidohydrolase family protein n=1 Tax=unclassified Cohnella TaxID=2636738 RepID=UPI00362FC077
MDAIRIVDTHMHLGTSRFSGVSTEEEDIIQAMDRNGVTASLVMPQPTLEDIAAVHARIAEMADRRKGRIFGMASLDPWLEEEAYYRQAEVCFRKYGFVAIKLHPLGHNVSPLSPQCDKVYETARAYDVPVLVHTGLGAPNALPSLVIDPARRYPDVRFILCHAGFAVYTDEAIVAAKYCDNIHLEPSWCQTYAVKKMVRTLGADRVLFGSDHLTNLPVELVKFQSIGLSPEELEKILERNAVRLFKLSLQ